MQPFANKYYLTKVIKIIFTNSKDIPLESEKINQLFAQGLDILHIKKSNYTITQLRQYIQKIDTKYHSQIVIQDHFDLLDEFPLKGIHVSRENRKKIFFNLFTLRMLKKKFTTMSISYTAESEKGVYSLLKRAPNYILLGKIFSENTTTQLAIDYGKEQLQHLNTHCKIPLIANGGVTAATVAKAQQLGFSGIAMNSAIWKSKNELKTFDQIIDIMEGKDIWRNSKLA